jgi:pilus assembly protein CpaE
MRAGIHEFVLSPADPADLAAAVDRLMRRAPSTPQHGQVVAVYSGKGGLGNTTIAVNLADALARNHARARVVIASLDITASDLRVFLNLPVTYDLGDLLAKLDRVDAELLDSLLTPTASGLWALPGAENPELDDEIDSAVMGTILEHLRSHFAFTVLDCEHHLSERTLAAMDAADRIVLVTQLNVAALKNTQKTLAICRRLGYGDEKMAVVVNRYESNSLLRRRDAEQVLTCEVFFSLPNDYHLTSTALAKGVTVGQVDSSADLSREFVKLAAKLGGSGQFGETAVPDESNESPFGRLISRLKGA